MSSAPIRAIVDEMRRLSRIAAEGSASLERLAALVEASAAAAEESAGPEAPQPEAPPATPAAAAAPEPDPAPVLEEAPPPADAEPEPSPPRMAPILPLRPAPIVREPVPAPPPPTGIAGEIVSLEEEIDLTEGHVGGWSRRARNAQIAVWAGRAREIQDRVAKDSQALPREYRDRLRWVFGRLTRIVKEKECGWVDALTEQWSTDWRAYVAFHKPIVVGETADLTPKAEAALRRDLLRGLFLPRRRVTPFEAQTAILEARQVLDDDDEFLARAIQTFGDPDADGSPRESTKKRIKKTADPEKTTIHEVPRDVLAVTRGKRALIAGGQGAREEQRQSLERAFEFSELEWVFTERNQASPFGRLAERIKGGRYDLVIYLAAYASHKGGAVVQACKEAGIPMVYLPRGYGVSALVHALQDQRSNGN